MKTVRFASFWCIVCCLLSLMVGCGDNSTSSSKTPVNADSLVAAANDSMAATMDEVINQTLNDPDSTLRPRDVDFTDLNSMYEQALAADPTNDSARFGAAFTGLMTFLADNDLNTLYERFKQQYDTSSILGRTAPIMDMGTSVMPSGMPLSSRHLGDVLPNLTRLDHVARLSTGGGQPTLSELQDLLETKLLPRIVLARNRMLDIIKHEDFVFVISPEMQGDPGASPIELDQADFRIIAATLYSMEAALHVFFARNLDLPSYDVDGLNFALDQQSSFLDLKSTGDTHMSTAKTRILNAAAQLDTAVSDLQAEITADPDQSNDLIPVYPDDMDDLTSAKDDIHEFQSYFDGPKDVTITWNEGWDCYWTGNGDSCVYTADSYFVRVDLSEFFDNPVDNPKSVLPGYQLSIQKMPDLYTQFAAQHFSRQRYLDRLLALYGTTDDTDTNLAQYGFYQHLPETNTAEFYEQIGYGPSLFGWDDASTWSTWPSDSLYYWYYDSYNQWQYRYLYDMSERVEVCYNWDASTFDAWTWPNPTFNGLFPNMTSAKLKADFTDFGGTWQQSDCDTFSLAPQLPIADAHRQTLR